MDEQLPLIDVEVETLPEIPVPDKTVFLVAAFCKQTVGGYWKIHRETNEHEHSSREEAERHAKRLSSQWTHRSVIRIRLGSEAVQALKSAPGSRD